MKKSINFAALMATKGVSKTNTNVKQLARQFVSKFKIKFDMKDDAIDLRTMAKNYPHEIIPLEDIHQAIQVMLAKKTTLLTTYDYDPSGGAVITYPNKTTSPRVEYITWDQAYLWPLFQRDVAPNHIFKILKDFEPTAVLIPCAIKLTIEGKVYFFIWDGHHTMQVCRFKGYNKFLVQYIDIDHATDEIIKKAGFGTTDEERIKYGIWLAGKNMIRINSTNKRPLSSYDEFMIKLETRDVETVKINNIFNSLGIIPKRHGVKAGEFSQFKSGIACYNLADVNGNKGLAFARACGVHRNTWPGSPMILEMWRPLALLHHECMIEGISLGKDFDDELADIIVDRWGDPDSAQEGIKDSIENARLTNTGHGICPDDNPSRVVAGMINLYNQTHSKTNYILPPAQYVWTV